MLWTEDEMAGLDEEEKLSKEEEEQVEVVKDLSGHTMIMWQILDRVFLQNTDKILQ